MLKKFAYIVAGIALFSMSLFFIVIVAYLVSSEVLPAIENGSLNVESSTMILNVVWEGNEIYILLAAYALLAAAFAWGAVKAVRKALAI